MQIYTFVGIKRLCSVYQRDKHRNILYRNNFHLKSNDYRCNVGQFSCINLHDFFQRKFSTNYFNLHQIKLHTYLSNAIIRQTGNHYNSNSFISRSSKSFHDCCIFLIRHYNYLPASFMCFIIKYIVDINQ